MTPRRSLQSSPDRLGEFLGARKFLHGVAEEKDEVGVAQGLAWTKSVAKPCRLKFRWWKAKAAPS
jgi:ATP-dependent Lon protease